MRCVEEQRAHVSSTRSMFAGSTRPALGGPERGGRGDRALVAAATSRKAAELPGGAR
jgi:hypothetical protein